jgi:hypothetical protein
MKAKKVYEFKQGMNPYKTMKLGIYNIKNIQKLINDIFEKHFGLDYIDELIEDKDLSLIYSISTKEGYSLLVTLDFFDVEHDIDGFWYITYEDNANDIYIDTNGSLKSNSMSDLESNINILIITINQKIKEVESHYE